MAETSVADSVEEFTEALRLNRRFKAPREALFRAFTDPVALAKWFVHQRSTWRCSIT